MPLLEPYLRDRDDLRADIDDWRRREYTRMTRATAAGTIAGNVLDLLDATDQLAELGDSVTARALMRDPACRLVAAGLETMALAIEIRQGYRPELIAAAIPGMLQSFGAEMSDSVVMDFQKGGLVLSVYDRMLRHAAERAIRSLNNLADGGTLEYDVSETHERELLALIALALTPAVLLPAPSLTA